jgi:hypothetical protein
MTTDRLDGDERRELALAVRIAEDPTATELAIALLERVAGHRNGTAGGNGEAMNDSDDFITGEEFEAAGRLQFELVDGNLYLSGRKEVSLGHGPAAHALLRIVAGRPDDASTEAVLAQLVAEQADAPKLTPKDLEVLSEVKFELLSGDLFAGGHNLGHGAPARTLMQLLAFPDDDDQGNVGAVIGAVLAAQTDALADEIVEWFQGPHIHTAEQCVFVRAKLQKLAATVIGQDRRELELRALQAQIDEALATPPQPNLRDEVQRLKELLRANGEALRALREDIRNF